MLSSQIIANTVLFLAFKENIPVSPMKLQKLVYFIYREYLQKYKNKLFSERFEKWKYGPVLPSIYYEFNNYGAKPISKFARDAQGKVIIVNVTKGTDLSTLIRDVWNKYKIYNGNQLSAMTHYPNTAWSRAKDLGTDILQDEDIENEPKYKFE